MSDQYPVFESAEQAGFAFADALDRGNWKQVIACLSPDCRYVFRGVTSEGAEKIVSSYQVIGEWVEETFESVRYESSVEARGRDSALIDFRDLLGHKEHRLDFRCQQVIYLGEDHRICRIEHIDIPGMQDKAEAFNRACGVVKP